MPLVMELVGSYYCPRIRCDGCGRLIDDGRGNVLYEVGDDAVPVGDLRFFHKPCDQLRPDFATRYQRDECWEELEHFLAFLLDNVGFDRGRAERQVGTLAEIGFATPLRKRAGAR